MREVVAGDRLDQYQLTDLLARSGMASVWKGIDTDTGAPVALKVPYLQYESDIVFHQRFDREERIGQRLEHPNIVKVYKPRDKSRMYMAMELVEGTSLRALLQSQSPLPTDRALAVGRQICDALAYMHKAGVVHRDLKPENILLTATDQVKILDFGIALDESARRLTWTRLSNTMGTPDYMAPEQIVGKRGDARTDVYALGTMLYEMLAGSLPFSSPNVHALLRAKGNEDPPPPSRYAPGIDLQLEHILLRAIARQPRDRYADASAMLEDLKDPSRVDPSAATATQQATRRALLRVAPRTAVALGFAALMCLLGALVWLSSRGASAPAETPGSSYRGNVVR